MLGHRQTSQSNAQTVTRRFIHLTVHHGHFIQYIGIFHLMVEVVTFTGTLPHACKYRQTAVRFGNIVDQFHHINGFTYTSTAKQTNLTTFGKGAKQVDHFNACFQQFCCAGQFIKFRCRLVNRACLVGTDRTCFIHRITQHVHNTAQCRFAHRHSDWRTSIVHG